MTTSPTLLDLAARGRSIAGHLPDSEGHDHNIKPHADGLAWLKACPDCAHRNSDPQKIGDVYQHRMMEFDGSTVFFCLHRRTENGFDRVCACFAATHRLAQVRARSALEASHEK